MTAAELRTTNQMNELVVVSKVAYGTPSFMWVRTMINVLLRERKELAYDGNEFRYSWLSKTIRALADLVYFKKDTRKWQQQQPVQGPTEYLPKRPKEPKKILKQQQPTLFTYAALTTAVDLGCVLALC